MCGRERVWRVINQHGYIPDRIIFVFRAYFSCRRSLILFVNRKA